MIGSRITRNQGESWAQFQARQRADSAAQTSPKPKRKKGVGNRSASTEHSDPLDNKDNLGESPDY